MRGRTDVRCWSLCVPSGAHGQVEVTVGGVLQEGSGVLARFVLISLCRMQVPYSGVGHCQVPPFSNYLFAESTGYF